MEPAEPMEPWKCNHRPLRRAPFHTRRGSGLREFMNKLPQNSFRRLHSYGFAIAQPCGLAGPGSAAAMLSIGAFCMKSLRRISGDGKAPAPTMMIKVTSASDFLCIYFCLMGAASHMQWAPSADMNIKLWNGLSIMTPIAHRCLWLYTHFLW